MFPLHRKLSCFFILWFSEWLFNSLEVLRSSHSTLICQASGLWTFFPLSVSDLPLLSFYQLVILLFISFLGRGGWRGWKMHEVWLLGSHFFTWRIDNYFQFSVAQNLIHLPSASSICAFMFKHLYKAPIEVQIFSQRVTHNILVNKIVPLVKLA